MAGNRIGGLKTAEKIRAKNPAHWQEIGRIGGRHSTGGGFAAKTPCDCVDIPGDHHKAQCAGMRGGRKRNYKQRLATQEAHHA